MLPPVTGGAKRRGDDLKHREGRDCGEANGKSLCELACNTNRKGDEHVVRPDAPEAEAVRRLRRENRIRKVGDFGIVHAEATYRQHRNVVGVAASGRVIDKCKPRHECHIAFALGGSAQSDGRHSRTKGICVYSARDRSPRNEERSVYLKSLARKSHGACGIPRDRPSRIEAKSCISSAHRLIHGTRSMQKVSIGCICTRWPKHSQKQCKQI